MGGFMSPKWLWNDMILLFWLLSRASINTCECYSIVFLNPKPLNKRHNLISPSTWKWQHPWIYIILYWNKISCRSHWSLIIICHMGHMCDADGKDRSNHFAINSRLNCSFHQGINTCVMCQYDCFLRVKNHWAKSFWMQLHMVSLSRILAFCI